MGKVYTDDVDKFLRDNKPKGKKEKLRLKTAAFYAAGYGIKEAKKRAVARLKTQEKRKSRTRRIHTK